MHVSRVSALAAAAALTYCVSPAAVQALRDRCPGDCSCAAEIYAPVTLTADLAALDARERTMVSLFIDAAGIMDDFVLAAGVPGRSRALLAASRTCDAPLRRDQLRALGRLPATRRSCRAWARNAGRRLLSARHDQGGIRARQPAGQPQRVTVLRRREKGATRVVRIRSNWREPLGRAAGLLERAAGLADDAGLRKYLELRAQALRTDDFRASDMPGST